MRVRKPALVLAGLVLSAALMIGIVQAGGSSDAKKVGPLSRAQVTRPIAGTPPTLAALHSPVSELRDGGKQAFDAQLRGLRGYPVVVNGWASWCAPCKFELPFFQRQAMRRGAQVAFLGINVQDARSAARRLTARYPLPYPSFVDRRGDIVRRFGARGLPVTAFYDAAGHEQMVHQGYFPSERALSEAIDRYAVR